ncbi:MAG TPA: AsmA family protein, partial [Gillisia sp.]|nr:AsmA family protein [Gillisia sp.]
MKNFLRKFLKVLLWIVVSIITLILLVLLLIQIPAVQNFIKDEAVAFLENKIETPVTVDRLEIGFPKKIILEGFYFEDQAGDTLAAGERLAVNINFYKLISSTVDIGSIELEGAVANISRNRDSVFNFDYIAEAFATDQPQDTTAAMEISIGTIDLDRIRFTFNDAISKSDMDVNLHHLDTRIGTFDPDNMTYEIPDINVDGLVLRMEQGAVESSSTPATVEEPAEESPPLNLGLGNISLANIDISFNSEEANIESAFTLEQLKAEIEELQMQEELASISNLEITGLRGNLIMAGSTAETAEANPARDTTSTQASNNWRVKLESMQFQDLAFRFKDENAPIQDEGINFMDMDLTGLNMDAERFYYSQDSISGRINSFTLRDHSGLHIQQFETDFAYAGTAAYLQDLYLETPHTLLRDKIVLEYPSLESLEEDIGNALVDARLDNSRIGFQDILLFAPDLRNTNPFLSNPNAVLRINGEVSGRVADLNINNFEASGIGNTEIAISGGITGLPDAENAAYNLNIRTFRTTAGDIKQFVPEGTIPDSIQLPETFSITGNFRGTAENFDT